MKIIDTLIYDSFEDYLNNYKALQYIIDDKDLIFDYDKLNGTDPLYWVQYTK